MNIRIPRQCPDCKGTGRKNPVPLKWFPTADEVTPCPHCRRWNSFGGYWFAPGFLWIAVEMTEEESLNPETVRAKILAVRNGGAI